MDDKTRQELEEAHKKAMEAMEAFNKEAKGLNNVLGSWIGK